MGVEELGVEEDIVYVLLCNTLGSIINVACFKLQKVYGPWSMVDSP